MKNCHELKKEKWQRLSTFEDKNCQMLSEFFLFFFHNYLTFSKNVKPVQNFQHWPNMSKLSKIKNRGECPSLSTLSKIVKNCQNYQYFSKFV